MVVYWSLFIFASIGALLEQSRFNEMRHRLTFGWIVVIIAMFVMIGFRWGTGGDWYNYYGHVQAAYWDPFTTTISHDPAFGLLIYLGAHLGGGMLLVTAASALIIAPCTARFSLRQPSPWLCLAVLTPYFVIVVGMGYIRQAIAISLCLIAFLNLERDSGLKFVGWMFCAMLFHSSAAMMLPIAFLTTKQNKGLMIVAGAVLVGIVYFTFLQDKAQHFVSAYVDSGADSSGAAVRIVLTAIPAAVLLAFKKRFDLAERQRKFWTLLAWGAVALVPILVISPSSTAVDRIGLYFIPIQGFVWSRFPNAFSKTVDARRLISFGILLAYGFSFFVWATYSSHAHYWTNYRFYFFDRPACTMC